MISWFARNSVAANLLMVTIMIGGVLALNEGVRIEIFPVSEPDTVTVSVPLRGATPEDVELGVAVRIEEAVQDIPGIVEINSRAREGFGNVTIEVATGEDINEILTEVKTRVDAIQTFPALTEKPVIYKQEVPIHVVFLTINGDLDEYARKEISLELRDELMRIPSVNQVQILGDRDYEISIEVSEHVLRQYGLSMSEISQAVRNSSIDTPGGVIRSEGGDILLRTEGQLYTGQEYADLVLRTYGDGTRLTIGDIANIEDGFVETHGYARYMGRPSASLRVLAVGLRAGLGAVFPFAPNSSVAGLALLASSACSGSIGAVCGSVFS